MEWILDPYYSVTGENEVTPAVMHSHDTYEIYCFLDGRIEYIVEGRRYVMERGDVMIMRKGEVHMFDRRSPSRYERIGIHFDVPQEWNFLDLSKLLACFNDRPSGKFNHYPARMFPHNQWISWLRKICQTEDPQKQLCYLLPLLCDLSEAFSVVRASPVVAAKDQAAEVMKYINQNLGEELSLDTIAGKFFISKAQLQRSFRRSAGTTVWEYITVKRLFRARERIEAGEHPSKVYEDCGFGDYATFYRAYKQHFGVSPREHMK